MHRVAILILLGALYAGMATGCAPMNEYRGPGDSVPVAGGGSSARGRRGGGPGSPELAQAIQPQFAGGSLW